jgi:hypothetical protein
MVTALSFPVITREAKQPGVEGALEFLDCFATEAVRNDGSCHKVCQPKAIAQ